MKSIQQTREDAQEQRGRTYQELAPLSLGASAALVIVCACASFGLRIAASAWPLAVVCFWVWVALDYWGGFLIKDVKRSRSTRERSELDVDRRREVAERAEDRRLAFERGVAHGRAHREAEINPPPNAGQSAQKEG